MEEFTLRGYETNDKFFGSKTGIRHMVVTVMISDQQQGKNKIHNIGKACNLDTMMNGAKLIHGKEMVVEAYTDGRLFLGMRKWLPWLVELICTHLLYFAIEQCDPAIMSGATNMYGHGTWHMSQSLGPRDGTSTIMCALLDRVGRITLNIVFSPKHI